MTKLTRIQSRLQQRVKFNMKSALDIRVTVSLVTVSLVNAYFIPQPDAWYTILSHSSGKALDVDRWNSSQIFPFGYKNTQIFRFEEANREEVQYKRKQTKMYRIFDAEYNDVLEVVGEVPNRDVARGQIKAKKARQLWLLKDRGHQVADSFIHIENVGNGMCLDVFRDFKHHGNKVNTWFCNDNPQAALNQVWSVLPLC